MNKFEKKIVELRRDAFCFVNLLNDYIEGNFDEKPEILIPLKNHINKCRLCQLELELIERAKDSSTKVVSSDIEISGIFNKFKEKIKKNYKEKEPWSGKIEPGQVWETQSFPYYKSYEFGKIDNILPYSLVPRPIIIVNYDEKSGEILGFPINSDYLEFSTNFDLIVDRNETELNFSFMVEVWNPKTTSKEFLSKYWGKIPPVVLNKIYFLFKEFLGEKVDGDIEVKTGKPIELDDDLRIKFQEVEAKVTEFISAPYVEKKEYEEFVLKLKDALNLISLKLYLDKNRKKIYKKAAASSDDYEKTESIILDKNKNKKQPFISYSKFFKPINPDKDYEHNIIWSIPDEIDVKDKSTVIVFEREENEVIGVGRVKIEGDSKLVVVSDIIKKNIKKEISSSEDLLIIIIEDE